ncbi:MAG: hypothetical protein C0599_16460 [Salinivirgaceae bacterium]|nr:MAG: hypothetical protein C0599_16460 [Salinivirgaceae bacterium]
MKKYLYKIALLSVAVLFTFAAQAEDLNKKENKTFKVKKGDNLIVDTRFSDVTIVNDKADQIEIVATIEVDGASKKQKSMFEEIQLILKQEGNNVIVKTDFPKRINLKDFEITFHISAPSYINLEANISFGNLFLEELQGKADLDVSYSTMKADVLASEDNELKFAFMDQVNIAYINAALINFSYSEVEIKKASVIKGKTSFSEIEIGEVDKMNLSVTKYDEWNIEKIGSFSATSRFSEIDLGFLASQLIIDINYGELDIERTSKDFELIDIESSFAECDINVESGASYSIEAEASFADVDFNSGEFKGNKNKKTTSMSLSGNVGNSPKGKVKIKTSYGDIDL